MIDPGTLELAKHAIIWERAFSVFLPAPARDLAERAAALLLDAGVQYFIVGPADAPAIMCVKCRMLSHNANDVKYRWCGHCRVFHPPAK